MNTTTKIWRGFEQYAETGNEFVRWLGSALNLEHDPDKTLKILERVFSGLRSHLPFHESVQTIELLPMAIRGLYVDGWEVRSGAPKLTTVEHFIVEVMGPENAGAELINSGDVIAAARAVIETIAHFSFGASPDHSIENLPRGLRNLYYTLTRISSRNDRSYSPARLTS